MSGPLHGLRVIEIAGVGPGPHCAMMLADLGADVVRIDSPVAREGYGMPVVQRGRRRVVLDLKTAPGREELLGLVAHADVLIESHRPGVAERLGIGPDDCLARNERLVYGRMTGWGQTGPWASMAGHDITYIAVTGVLHAVGRAGQPPVPPMNLLGDFGGGSMYLLAGVLAALWERDRSGRGQVVDASIIDGTANLAAMIMGMRAGGSWTDVRGVNSLDSGAPFYDVYETADGKWLAVGALEYPFFAELARVLGLDPPDDHRDPATWDRLRVDIAARVRTRTRDDWAEAFAGTDGCAAPVLTFAEAAAHPQMVARGALVERDGVLQPAPAPRFSRTSNGEPGRAVPETAQSGEVLAGWRAGEGRAGAGRGVAPGVASP